MNLKTLKNLLPKNYLPMIAECIIDDLKNKGWNAKLKENKKWKKLKIVPVNELSPEDLIRFNAEKDEIQKPYLDEYISTLRELKR